MSSEKFIKNNLALTTLVCACVVVLMSLSVRQVFGMFFIDFNNDLGISNTEFGLAIGIQMLGWGLSGPIFGVLADKYGGHKSIILAFLFYILGVYFLYAGPNTGIYFQISLGVLIGIGCGGTAISIPMSIVGKHFPLSNRTIAMSIHGTTNLAAGDMISLSYFPTGKNHSLGEKDSYISGRYIITKLRHIFSPTTRNHLITMIISKDSLPKQLEIILILLNILKLECLVYIKIKILPVPLAKITKKSSLASKTIDITRIS